MARINFILSGGVVLKIRSVCFPDIPAWILLSKEYDNYVLEIVPDLIEWYEGSNTLISFDKYMQTKINQKEAYMAINENDNCCGIIALSKTNNRITFFGVSHKYDFYLIGELLLAYALSQLNVNSNITINIIKSNAEQIQKEYTLLNKFNFIYLFDDIENGVPVKVMELNPKH